MKSRDDFTAATKKTIAARVGYLCSNPECQAQTAGPTADSSKFYNVGVAAHITAAAKGGPRYDPSLTPEQRRHPDNGIWLCCTHAKQIDDDPVRFTVDLLRTWKREAEMRTLSRLKASASPKGISPVVAISMAERYGLETSAILENGQVIPLAAPFGLTTKPTWFANPCFIVRFLVAKQTPEPVLIEQIRATVYDWQPTPAYKLAAYALPVLVNPYIVELAPPIDGKPRPCIAELYFHEDQPEATQFAVLKISDDAPEVIDVRFNAIRGGLYTIALDVKVVHGVCRRTHRVLDPSPVLFLEREE